MLQNTLHHLTSRYSTTKNALKLALTGLLFCIPFTTSHACSVHDHGCVYHGFNATVNTSYPTTNTDTSVVLYSIGKTPNTGTPSNVDFDNKVWIPELTGDKVNGSYTTPTGAYILNNTAYGTTHPPADTYAPDDRHRLVYPSQYQITFNQNSAVAKHTGDFNGAENGNIPNATGCPNMPNAANCEAVVVTGNVPTGFYDQQVRIFNSTGNPNPAVDLQVGVYTTGKARLVTPSHIDNGNETADFQSISGTGATTPLYRYEIVNTGYDPHAGGVAWFDRNRTYTTGYGKPYTSGSHIYQNRFDTTDTTRTKIYKYGAGEQSLQARSFSTKHLYLGEVAPPLPPPVTTPNSKFDLLAFVQNKSVADQFMSGFTPIQPAVTKPDYANNPRYFHIPFTNNYIDQDKLWSWDSYVNNGLKPTGRVILDIPKTVGTTYTKHIADPVADYVFQKFPSTYGDERYKFVETAQNITHKVMLADTVAASAVGCYASFGAGCVVLADYGSSSTVELFTGNHQPTVGAQIIQKTTGLSESDAESAYLIGNITAIAVNPLRTPVKGFAEPVTNLQKPVPVSPVYTTETSTIPRPSTGGGTVKLTQDTPLANGTTAAKGSTVTVTPDGAMKVTTPEGQVIQGSYEALNQKQISSPSLNNQLPGREVTRLGESREMPATLNPNLAAENFAKTYLNDADVKFTPLQNGWVAVSGDTFVTYRPAGQAGMRTVSTTATVEINNSAVKTINAGEVLKLKFPKIIE